MPKSAIAWKPRRKLTESPKSAAKDFLAAGRELMAADMPVEAAELLAKAKDSEGLNLLKTAAIEEGNFFIYQLVTKLQQSALNRDEIKALADKAASLGLEAYENSARNILNENP
ncbi:MAG: hypothetical protein LBF38_08010 [Deltaproteobacteria bacterium]|jgi:hypothetical protein|nr:hypothetical protein [Deltaproteobacteria bacterium]